jgi:hypothetical protein
MAKFSSVGMITENSITTINEETKNPDAVGLHLDLGRGKNQAGRLFFIRKFAGK